MSNREFPEAHEGIINQDLEMPLLTEADVRAVANFELKIDKMRLGAHADFLHNDQFVALLLEAEETVYNLRNGTQVFSQEELDNLSERLQDLLT